MTSKKNGDNKIVNLDDVLSKFGMFDGYNRLCMLLVFLAFITNAMYSTNYVFVAEETGYRCVDEEAGNNFTCHSANRSCRQWVYDNPHSFVAEFQLACQEWKRTLVGTVHSFGYMVGLLIVGPMSDRLGRKTAIVITGVSGGLFGLARSFTSWYWLYIFLEFMESAIGDICSPMYMMAIETVSSKKRVTYLMLCSFGYPVGGMVLALAAWQVPYWRNLLRVIYAPALLFTFYIYLLDESPRWLLSKGKKEIATNIIEKAADKSKIKLDKNIMEKLSYEQNEDVNFVRLLKSTFLSRALLKRFVVCLTWWMTSTFVNYGMTINSVSLQGNKYVNFGLLAFVEIPGGIAIAYILNNFKRKLPLILSFVIGAVLCFVQPFVPAKLMWLATLVYILGKLMSSFYFNITYMYTSELFPTYTRNCMHALCSSIGRIGSIIAPQTPLLMHYWFGLPSIIFGSVSLFAGLVTFLVPDTANNSLPDNIIQAEALSNKSKEALANSIRANNDFDVSVIFKEDNLSKL